jgi:hypothetical protein
MKPKNEKLNIQLYFKGTEPENLEEDEILNKYKTPPSQNKNSPRKRNSQRRSMKKLIKSELQDVAPKPKQVRKDADKYSSPTKEALDK